MHLSFKCICIVLYITDSKQPDRNFDKSFDFSFTNFILVPYHSVLIYQDCEPVEQGVGFSDRLMKPIRVKPEGKF